jgi:hypothetical protein
MSSSITAMGRTANRVNTDNTRDRVEPGQVVTFDAVTHLNEVDTDPTELTFQVTDPSNDTTLYTYGTDVEIVRDQIGHYQIAFTVPNEQDSVGTWAWEWVASGVVNTRVSGELVVSDKEDPVTLTVLDPDTTPVKEALVSVFRNGTLVDQGRTDATGVVKMGLEDGVYQVEVQKDGYRTPVTSLIVSGVTGATITSTDLKTQGLAPVVRLCRVFGWLIDVTGQPMIEANVHIEPVGVALRAFVQRNGIGVNPVNQGVARDRRMIRARETDGYWEVDLLQDSLVKIHIPSLGFTKIFRVPRVNSINVADIRTDVGQPSLGSLRGERYQLI